MAGPKAQVIGRVAVKVVPNTDDFRRLAERALKKEEDRLHAEARIIIDRTKLKREAFEAVKDLNNTLRRSDAYKVRFFATISKTGMREAVAEAAANLNRRADREQIKFDGLLTKVELDREALKKVEHDLKDWRDDISPLVVEVRPSMWTGAASYINARLGVLTRPREVKIIPVLDKTALAKVATALAALSGIRAISSALDDLWDSLKRLDKSVPIIGTIAEAIAGLGAYGLTAASNLFALSQSLAQIGPAVLALPGIFGGITIGVGTTLAALKDFNKVLPEVKKKFQHLQDQISKNFWAEAETPIRNLINSLLPELSAGLQQTATELGGFFGNLANAFRGVFNGALKGMFEDLSSSIEIMSLYTRDLANIIKILGEVGAGYLPDLAQWFGSILVQFNNFLTKAQRDGSLRDWIDTGVRQLQLLGQSLGSLVGIFAGLAKAASKAGGSTLDMFADTMERVNRAVNSKGFQKTLVSVLRAAHQSMSKIAQISGPSVSKFFKSLADTATKVFPVMGDTIGHAFKAIFDALSQPAVGKGLVDMFKGLNKGMKGLAPAAKPIGKALGGLFQIIGQFGENEGKLAGAVFGALARAFTQMAPSVKQIIALMGQNMLGAINGLMPAFKAFVGLIGDVLTKYVLPQMKAILPKVSDGFKQIGAAIAPALDALGELVGILAPVLMPVLRFVATILIDTVVLAFKGVANVIKGVVDVLAGLIGFFKAVFTGDWAAAWDNIKRIAKGVWELILGAFQLFISVGLGKILKIGMGLFRGVWKGGWVVLKTIGKVVWDGIKSVFKKFLGDLKAAPQAPLRAIANLFKNIWNGIKGFIRAVWNGIVQIVRAYINTYKSIITGGFNLMKSIISRALETAKSLVKKAWSAIQNFFSGGIKGVISKIKSLPGKIKAGLGNLGGLLVGAGKAVVQGFINGVKAMFGAVQSAFRWITDKIPDWKGPKDKDKTLLFNAGKIIIDGLIRGLESRFGQVKNALSSLTKTIHDIGDKSLSRATSSARARLDKLLRVYDDAAKRMKAARDRLKQLREDSANYAQQIADTIRQTGNVTGFTDDDGKTSFAQIITGLADATTQALQFAAALKKLDRLGLSKTAIDQIAQAGPEAGLAAAKAIIDAGKAGIGQINSLIGSLTGAANAAGAYASDAMYQNGIRAAQGLVDGLESQMSRIEKSMTKIARNMVGVIKRELGIHSPSRVFAELGSFVGQGFTQGIVAERKSVLSAMSSLTDISGIDASNMASRVTNAVNASVSEEGTVIKQLNYYAAPNNSLDSEEDLFAASSRARMAW